MYKECNSLIFEFLLSGRLLAKFQLDHVLNNGESKKQMKAFKVISKDMASA